LDDRKSGVTPDTGLPMTVQGAVRCREKPEDSDQLNTALANSELDIPQDPGGNAFSVFDDSTGAGYFRRSTLHSESN
jgi:hypothetical protein